MNPSDTQITNGSCPMMISGREFKAQPLNDKDFAELSEYVQFQMIDLAKKYSANLFPSERKEFIQAAISSAAGVRWDSQEGSRILSSAEGGARIAWQMIHQKNGMKFDEFKLICFHDNEKIRENLDEIDRVFIKLNTIQKDSSIESLDSIDEAKLEKKVDA